MKLEENKIKSRFAIADQYIEELMQFQNHITVNDLRTDLGTRSRVERAFEVIIQVIIDVCTHIVSNNFEVPQTYSSCIELLRDKSILDSDLSDNLIDAVKMRNIIALQYTVLDLQIIHESIDQLIEDYKSFRKIIVTIINT